MAARHQKILLIDDSEADLTILRFLIEDFDDSIEIVSAHDGAAALRLLASSATLPSIIVLDLNMSGMDGSVFLAEYQRYAYECPVVIISASPLNRVNERCMDYPCVKAFLLKPLSFDEISSVIWPLTDHSPQRISDLP